MNKKGYRISTEVFTTEQFQQYKQFFESRSQYSIEIKGQPNKGRAMIYFAEMAYLLLESGIIAKNLDTNTEEILPGGQYAQSYIEGFNEGVAHFNERWSLMPDTLYGSKSDHYFNDLRAAYEGTGDQDTPLGIVSNAMSPGWLEEAGCITLFPFNDESVKNNGYYAGLVFKYREMQKRHDRLRMETATSQDSHQPRKPKEYDSLRRVHSFILAEAYRRGMTLIKDMSKVEFMRYAKERFKVKSGASIYQTVRSTYKGESNFINYYTEMKREYLLDHEFAMKIFNEYYPDLG